LPAVSMAGCRTHRLPVHLPDRLCVHSPVLEVECPNEREFAFALLGCGLAEIPNHPNQAIAYDEFVEALISPVGFLERCLQWRLEL
jgi:hypothetical protein